MDDLVDEWEKNGGICDECFEELATGRMRLDAPVEFYGSSFNMQQSPMSAKEYREMKQD